MKRSVQVTTPGYSTPLDLEKSSPTGISYYQKLAGARSRLYGLHEMSQGTHGLIDNDAGAYGRHGGY